MVVKHKGDIDKIKRGDIVLAVLCGKHGSSIQRGKRPCLVISNNTSNKYAPILNVYPLTKRLKHNPVHVIIQSKEVAGELRFDSDFLGEQPTTIDRNQVIEVITHIDEDSEIMKKVEEAIVKQYAFHFVGKEVS